MSAVENNNKVSKSASDDCCSTITTSKTNVKLSTQARDQATRALTYADVVKNNIGRNERMAVGPTLSELTGSEQPASS